MASRRSRWLHTLFFIGPALLLFLVFVYYPFLSSLYYSFTQWDGVTSPTFIGFQNYTRLFGDPTMIDATRHTLWMVLAGLLIANPASLLLALALNLPLKTRGALRTIFYIPVIMSLIVVSFVWGDILQYYGSLNGLLKAIGLGGIIRDWLGTMNTALPSVILISIWGGIGYGAVIYLAGLQTIPLDLYEAAAIDGATGWPRFRHITFPLLMPAVTITLFLGLVGSLKFFDLPYVLTNGGPGDATTTVALAIYDFAFQNGTYGYAIAAGVLFMLAILAITTTQLLITRRLEVEL